MASTRARASSGKELPTADAPGQPSMSITDKTGKLLTTPAGRLLTQEEVAAYLGGISPKTLELWRRQGIGPDFVLLGPKLIRYRPKAVDDWVIRLERKNRAEAAA